MLSYSSIIGCFSMLSYSSTKFLRDLSLCLLAVYTTFKNGTLDDEWIILKVVATQPDQGSSLLEKNFKNRIVYFTIVTS